ncbi:MAG: hypothetical protein WA425_13900, partial [Xanthobacteraceae bacterium]
NSGTIGVEVEKKSGSYAMPNHTQIFLDTGSHNTITVKDEGGKLIAAGGADGCALVGGAAGGLLAAGGCAS